MPRTTPSNFAPVQAAITNSRDRPPLIVEGFANPAGPKILIGEDAHQGMTLFPR